MSIGIYKITNPKGAIYIGSSRNVEQRFRGYKCPSCAKNQHKLRRSLLKYGHENHIFEIVTECELDQLFELERLIGMELDVIGRGNLNLMLPASGDIPAVVSTGTKLKMKNAWVERKKSMSDSDLGRLGRWVTENLTGVPLSAERVAKMRQNSSGESNPMFGKRGELHPMFGRKHSADARKNMTIGQRKRTSKKGYIHINSKRVVDFNSGEVFNSAKDAATKLNMNYSTLRSMLQGANPNRTTLRYE